MLRPKNCIIEHKIIIIRHNDVFIRHTYVKKEYVFKKGM